MSSAQKRVWPETAIIWGAGATASLGLATSDGIGRILSRLAGVSSDKNLSSASLQTRIDKAFEGRRLAPEINEALHNLLILLYDGDDAQSDDDAYESMEKVADKLVKRHGRKLNKKEKQTLKNRLITLHNEYDWVGVRAVAKYIARKWDKGSQNRSEIELVDILTTVDQLYDLNLSIPTEELFHPPGVPDNKIYLIGKKRLIGIQKCLTHLMSTVQRALMLGANGKMGKGIDEYYKIAEGLATLMKDEGLEYYKRGYASDSRAFYLFSYALISFNWDPIILRLIYCAHKKKNDRPISVNGNKLRLFNDAGDGIGFRKIPDKDDPANDLFALMMNEQACRTVNNPKYLKATKDSRLMRIGKILFPHAGFGWRICPRCGKLITDLGDNWKIHAGRPFGPDLLPNLSKGWTPRTEEEERAWKQGNFAAMECTFCGTLTNPCDCPLILQSGLKPDRHYVLDGIFHELGLVVGNARHLVFAGYSLPKDDFIYRCYFQASLAGKSNCADKMFCTFINYDKRYLTINNKLWLEGSEIISYLKSDDTKTDPNVKQSVENILELFDIDYVRVSLHGIPNVFINNPSFPTITDAIKDVLYPDQCFPEGFPPIRM